ncbi:MAG: NADH-quinone reductase, partial [Clostridiales bacterium]|nr:NADH-quinone reductase [Clostridiales bacterium]
MRHFFHGGIHPTDGTDKDLNRQVPIRIYTPKVVEISMKQSPNSVCKALVKIGDKVSKGDIIG